MSIQAQSDERIKNHNLILNADIASGNLYTMAASSVVTGLANYYLFEDAFFENSFAYSLYSTNENNLKVKTMNPMGMTASELFNNIQAGIKLGYQTYATDVFVNGGIYASSHYKLEQFDVGYNKDNMQKHRSQRVLIGVTGRLSLGPMDKATRVIVEAGVRYSLALAYKSPIEEDKNQLNNGLVSHYAIMLAGRKMWQNVGIYADINHFDMWKNLYPNRKLDNYTFGITWTITPQQVDKRKDW